MVLLNVATIKAQSFNFNANCQTAYEDILALQLKQGKQQLKIEQTDNPTNLLPLLLLHYSDFFNAVINEQQHDLDLLVKQKEERLAIIQAKGDKSSPYFLYVQAEINLQTAFARLKSAAYMNAFWEFRKAYRLLNENTRRFPSFYPNQKSLGVLHALIGTVPDEYGWAVDLLGMEGSVVGGMDELRGFLAKAENNNFPTYKEGEFLYAFLLIYLENDKNRAWQLIQKWTKPRGLLQVLVTAEVAMRSGHNDYAIKVLQERPQYESYADFYLLDYLLGTCKLYRLDDDAAVFLERFVQNFKGKHYVKNAYAKLAWCALLKEQETQYYECLNNCKSKGAALTGNDKQAQKNAEIAQKPNVDLLKARLLFDGGYYSKALLVLEQINMQMLETSMQQLEFTYRYARVYEGLANYDKAMSTYKQTLVYPHQENDFFVPKASLQLAQIYEQQGDFSTAKTYFKRCLGYTNYAYKTSVDQQAKAGLNRCR